MKPINGLNTIKSGINFVILQWLKLPKKDILEKCLKFVEIANLNKYTRGTETAHIRGLPIRACI